MATELDDNCDTQQQGIVRLARGTILLLDQVGETIATLGVDTWPTDPIDTRYLKRILVRVSHPSADPFTAGFLTIEFSDTEAFTNVTFFQTIPLNVATNPLITLMGANIAADVTHHVADLDVETMDAFCRIKVRNDSAGTITYRINAQAKVS